MFATLGGALARRGHRVSFLVHEGAEQDLDVDFHVQPVEGTDKRRLDKIISRASRPSGPLGILRTVHDGAVLTDAFCQNAPKYLRALRVDAILGDQMEPAAGLVARHLGLPLLSVACALPVERDDGIPLPFLSWPYDPSLEGMRRNRGGERVARLLLTEQRRLLRRWALRMGLQHPIEDLQACVSETATIAQTTAAFDLPRLHSNNRLHSVGPLRSDGKAEELPFAVDPDRPFIFMSLGTLQGHRYRLFRAAAIACRQLDVQLLVAHCGGLSKQQEDALGATWVTSFAPQRAVLERADLCITHGGLNTVMDALEFATPLLVLPIAFDQPGVSARVLHHDVGLRLSPHYVTGAKMKKAIMALLADQGYVDRAREVGRSIAAAGGLQKAVDIIEAAVGKREISGSTDSHDRASVSD
ncbi:MAG: glycosyltransferase [Pseudorhizobium sp.]